MIQCSVLTELYISVESGAGDSAAWEVAQHCSGAGRGPGAAVAPILEWEELALVVVGGSSRYLWGKENGGGPGHTPALGQQAL